MEKWIVVKNKKKDDYYVSLGISGGYGKGYKRSISIGSLSVLEKTHENALDVLKQIAKTLPTDADKEYIKSKISEAFELTKVEFGTYNVGVELLYKIIKDLELFQGLEKGKKKQTEEIFEFLIAKRILEPESMLRSFTNKHKFINEINVKKSTVYNFLDFVAENKQKLVKNVNNKISEVTNRNVSLVFMDATTLYFETFVNTNEDLKEKFTLKRAGYSKDGKFKEDQVVLGMVTDSNGIPLDFALLPGNVADQKTLIPTINELGEIYNITNVTVIADKGMNQYQNKMWLKNNGLNYIFPVRLKGTSKKFKEYVVNETDYKEIDGLLCKEVEQVNIDAENNAMKVRQVVIYDKYKAKRDAALRNEVIERFNKIKSTDGTATARSMISYKKYKYFKEIQESKFAMDMDKVREDKKLDGYIVFETTRWDLSIKEILDIYKNQWRIENNFRDLKTTLETRPMFVRTDEHVLGHITICFIALVILNYLTWLVNKNQAQKLGVLDKITSQQILLAIKSAMVNFKKVDGVVVEEKMWSSDEIKEEIELYHYILNLIK
ncbi:IS1634 family transposase [Mycoplasma aquilae ATCC BAA-1896]|uniref:IS1634 family transposase n=1 Tax=Mycoplasma aquilae TaxID=1312741 RepID=UPI003A8B3561